MLMIMLYTFNSTVLMILRDDECLVSENRNGDLWGMVDFVSEQWNEIIERNIQMFTIIFIQNYMFMEIWCKICNIICLISVVVQQYLARNARLCTPNMKSQLLSLILDYNGSETQQKQLHHMAVSYYPISQMTIYTHFKQNTDFD